MKGEHKGARVLVTGSHHLVGGVLDILQTERCRVEAVGKKHIADKVRRTMSQKALPWIVYRDCIPLSLRDRVLGVDTFPADLYRVVLLAAYFFDESSTTRGVSVTALALLERAANSCNRG